MRTTIQTTTQAEMLTTHKITQITTQTATTQTITTIQETTTNSRGDRVCGLFCVRIIIDTNLLTT